MAKRDPNLTARNKRIKSIKEELRGMLELVLEETGIEREAQLNAIIGSKNDVYFDLKHDVISSAEEFQNKWADGLVMNKEAGDPASQNIFRLLTVSDAFKKYLLLFLERSFLNHYSELYRSRPAINKSILWIGQKNANYGLLVTPRFKDGNWENDKSEIRAFKREYWTIGHVLETGLVIPNENESVQFGNVQNYLNFFRNVLVRNSGSIHEKSIADLYREYVLSSDSPEKIPLLIPEFRYLGLRPKHEHRLDFMIVDPYSQRRVGIELSPWSTHGYLSGTKGKKQYEINQEAQDNFEKEMEKHRAYFKKHDVTVLIYTDSNLADYQELFNNDIRPLLETEPTSEPMKFAAYKTVFGG